MIHRHMVTSLFLCVGVLVLFCLSYSVGANPIPVYPDPEPTLVSSGGAEPFPVAGLGLIFIVNFCVDILILYSGLIVLDRFQVLPEEYVISLSKGLFFGSVAVISILGLGVEYVLGSWIGGLVLAALVILGSFVFVGHFLLRLSGMNSIRLGFFALIINIVMWTIFYIFI